MINPFKAIEVEMGKYHLFCMVDSFSQSPIANASKCNYMMN